MYRVVLRDAVALVGTGPALLTIKSWIQSRSIQGEEAAEVLSVLPHSAQSLDVNYINTLFVSTDIPILKSHFLFEQFTGS